MSSLCLMLIKSSWLNSGSKLAFLTSRARWLKTTVSPYSPARDSRPIYHTKEDFQSRVRRAGSGHQVFRRDAASSYWSYYVWKFGDFLCLTFFVVSLLCNLNKIL